MPLNGPAVLHAGKTASYHGTISAAACAEQWSAFCVGIMICIGALITVAVRSKGTKLSAEFIRAEAYSVSDDGFFLKLIFLLVLGFFAALASALTQPLRPWHICCCAGTIAALLVIAIVSFLWDSSR